MSAVLAAPRPAVGDEGRRPHLRVVGPGFVAELTPPPGRLSTERRPAAAPVRLSRRGRALRAVLAWSAAAVLAGSVGAVAGQAVAAGGTGALAGPTESVTVAHGETLWSIASGATASGADVRATLETIVDLNGLASSVLVPGTQLAVPAR